MLGFSLSKLMVLAAILGAVWYGFKLIGRLDAARKRKVDSTGRGDHARTGQGRSDSSQPAPRPDGVVDLIQDETGAYVAKEKRDDRI
jgi:hypothetical protein